MLARGCGLLCCGSAASQTGRQVCQTGAARSTLGCSSIAWFCMQSGGSGRLGRVDCAASQPVSAVCQMWGARGTLAIWSWPSQPMASIVARPCGSESGGSGGWQGGSAAMSFSLLAGGTTTADPPPTPTTPRQPARGGLRSGSNGASGTGGNQDRWSTSYSSFDVILELEEGHAGGHGRKELQRVQDSGLEQGHCGRPPVHRSGDLAVHKAPAPPPAPLDKTHARKTFHHPSLWGRLALGGAAQVPDQQDP